MLRRSPFGPVAGRYHPQALAQPPVETVPLLREIKQWVIGCDNLRNCHALSAPSGVDEEGLQLATLHLWHQAGPEGYLRLRFDHRGQAVDLSTLRLDGQPLGPDLTRDLHVELDDQGGDPDMQSYGVIEERRGVCCSVCAMAGACSCQGGRGHTAERLSAALLLMDAVQGRVDNVTALARPGQREEVPPRLPTPVLRRFEAAPPLSATEQAGLVAAALQAVTPDRVKPKQRGRAVREGSAIVMQL